MALDDQSALRPHRGEAQSGSSPRVTLLLLCAFFLSGGAALVYELLWFRLLGPIFGSTATATATLLSSYLFGLGIGAWLFGPISDRVRSPARVYAWVETGIGLYGIASHALLERSAPLYAAAHALAEGGGGRLLLARFLVSFALIALPTALMGGTFPLMVRLLERGGGDAGRAAGRAYAANTAGAATGTLLLPFALLPGLGVARALIAAAAANLAAAACALGSMRGAARRSPDGDRSRLLDPRHAADGGVETRRSGEPGGDKEPAARTRDSSLEIPLLCGFFLSSFAAIALETVWTRHLGLFFGAQIYTFAFVLFSYLSGLFVGGALYAVASARGFHPGTLLRCGLAAAAISTALPLPFLARLPVPQIEAMLAMGPSPRTFLLTSAIESLVLLMPAAVGLGVVFPSIVDLLARGGRRTGVSVGITYAVNTVGTTLGAAVTGFLLVPAAGSQRVFEISILLLAAAMMLAPSPRGGTRRTWISRYALPAALLAVLALPRWDWRLAHALYAKDPAGFLERWTHGTLEKEIATYRLLSLAEGAEATVSVNQFASGHRSLYVNGKPDASNFPDDMVTQRLLACIPALFHPHPVRALVIGVGSGTTVATLGRFPIETIDAAEISPDVVNAARDWFPDINDRFLDDPRVSLHLDDGRNYLRFRPPSSYDLIISEPSNPWMAGVSALFTDEFFAEARERLRPGGILCQWFHYYNMSMVHVRLVARTFVHRFPDSAILVLRGDGPVGDLVLVGSKGPLRLARMPEDPALPEGVRQALSQVKNGTSQQLLSGLVAGPGDLARFAGEGPLNTDDLPILEIEAPADRFLIRDYDNLAELLSANERIFLPAGPSPAEAPAAREIEIDGIALPEGVPSGDESRRGATVLVRVRPGGQDISRWVLLGREFVSTGSTTGLYRLARIPSGAAELAEVTAALVGGATSAPTGPERVHDHPAIWVESELNGQRSVALGWFCPRQDRAFFVLQRAPSARLGDAALAARALAARFPCRHDGP